MSERYSRVPNAANAKGRPTLEEVDAARYDAFHEEDSTRQHYFEAMVNRLNSGMSSDKKDIAMSRRAFMAAEQIRTAILALGDNYTDEQYQQTVADRQDKLAELIGKYCDEGALSKDTIDFLFEYAAGTYDDLIDDKTSGKKQIGFAKAAQKIIDAGAEKGNIDLEELARVADGEEPVDRTSPQTDDEPTEPGKIRTKTNLAQTYEIPAELAEKLNDSREAYAMLIAKDHQSLFGRFLQGDSKVGRFLEKLPFVKKLAQMANNFAENRRAKRNNADLAVIREAYATNMAACVDHIINSIGFDYPDESFTEPWTKEQIENLQFERAKRAELFIKEDISLESRIAHHRQEQSKDAGWFTNWWVRQTGVGGAITKALVVGTAGAVAGAAVATAGLAGGLIATGAVMTGGVAAATSGAVGAFGGSMFGRSMNKRRANAKVDNPFDEKSTEKITVAQRDSLVSLAKKKKALSAIKNTEQGVVTLIGNTEKDAADAMLRNRREVKSTTGAAVVGATLGASAVRGFLVNALGPTEAAPQGIPGEGYVRPDSAVSTANPTPEIVPEVADPGVTEIVDNSLNVEPGNGFTHEFMELAEANNNAITPEQAYHQVFEPLKEKYGIDDLIDAQVDQESGWIMQPGSTNWKPGVKEDALELINKIDKAA